MAPHSSGNRRKPLKANAATLAALGAERLAELLAAAARADTSLKRLLTLEVAESAEDLAEEIDKQVLRVRVATGRLNAPRANALAREVQRLVSATSARLGALDPIMAAERLLDMLDASSAILARRTGEGRTLVEAFASISDHIAALMPAAAVGPGRDALLATVHRLSSVDEVEAAEGLLAAVAAAGSRQDRATLCALVELDLAAVAGSGARAGAIAHRVQALTQALAVVADADGDVDAFRAAQERRDPRLRDHLAIVERLIAAGRAAEALEVLEATPAGVVRSGPSYAEARIATLEALGLREEAQADRWAHFWASLSLDALRGFLKRLPDFEDVEREDAALAHVEQHHDAMAALAFLVAWPDHRRAAALVRRRTAQLDGRADSAVCVAAEQFAHRDPLAATLLYRLSVDAALSQGGANAKTAKTLLECASLASAVTDWDGRLDHHAYMGRLRTRYGRQGKFWRKLATMQ